MIANGQNVAHVEQVRESVESDRLTVKHVHNEVLAALEEWETFISHPDAESRLALRVQVLARAGRFDEIPQTAEMLRTLDAESAYNAARGYALCAGALQPADGQELTPEQQTQRRDHIDLAFTCLREAIAAGWIDFETWRRDPDLAVLHDLPEFEQLLDTPPPPPLSE
jgi:hypothetical protein